MPATTLAPEHIGHFSPLERAFIPVSYTHLDVYKRQVTAFSSSAISISSASCSLAYCASSALYRADVYKRQLKNNVIVVKATIPKIFNITEIKREIEKGHPAHAYGRYQNVFLTDGELADLQASFPTVWGQYIEKLSEYMASTGKRYQSHAATIRRWAGEDAKKTVTPSRNRDYSVKEDETV